MFLWWTVLCCGQAVDEPGRCLERPRDRSAAVSVSAFREQGALMRKIHARLLLTIGLWAFLAPLIIILGVLDLLTAGGSRSWLLSEPNRF
jgi:hypothetical protein